MRREKPTLRQLLANLAGARGHFTFAGTPEQVADLIEDWFTDGAADGFNIMPPLLPAMLDVFSAEVIPLLQRRGLFRTAYEGKTLREHYGLAWPKSAFDGPMAQQAALRLVGRHLRPRGAQGLDPATHIVDIAPANRTLTMTHAPELGQRRKINWLNINTVLSAAILIGAEVFGAAYAGGWAVAMLLGLGDMASSACASCSSSPASR